MEKEISLLTMENKSLEQIIEARLEKLDKIRELGINPYPYEFKITILQAV